MSILGQLSPSANTITSIYEVPEATKTTITTITICNVGVATTFSLAMALNGASDNANQYIYNTTPITEGATLIITATFNLDAKDTIRVMSGSQNGNVNFIVFGIEAAA